MTLREEVAAPVAAAEADRGIARLEAFSDGVFAIAITLLILDIKVPRAEHELTRALLAQWPSYVGYVGSFVIIGISGRAPAATSRSSDWSDDGAVLPTPIHLLCIGFLPFATALLTEYLAEGGAPLATAAVVYVGTLLLVSITFNAVWRYAAHAGCLRPEIGPGVIARTTRLYALSALCYAVAFAAAFVVPVVALLICVGMALYYGLPVRHGLPGAASNVAPGR